MNCHTPTCEDKYIDETAPCIHERIKDHSGRDQKLHMSKHSIEKHHDNVIQENFKIIAKLHMPKDSIEKHHNNGIQENFKIIAKNFKN